MRNVPIPTNTNNKKVVLRWATFLGLAIFSFAAYVAVAALTFTTTNVTGDGALTVDNAGVLSLGNASATAITIGKSGITVSFPANVSSSGSLTITGQTTLGSVSSTNISASTSLVIPANQSLSASGQISVKTTSSTLNYHDGTAERVLNSEQCFAPSWTIQNVTSTPSDEVVWIPKANSIITQLSAVNLNNGDSMQFNIIWATSRNQASSTSNHLFASNVTSTATTTPDIYPTLVAFASTTVNANQVVRILTGPSASTTDWSFSLCFRQVP